MIPSNFHRATLANGFAGGPMGDAQRRAMWAKRSNPAASTPPRIRLPGVPSGSGAHYVDEIQPAPVKAVSKYRFPGAPSGSGAHYADEITTRPPSIVRPGRFPGGSANFDEGTGQYRSGDPRALDPKTVSTISRLRQLLLRR